MKKLASITTRTFHTWNVPALALMVLIGLALCCTNALAQSGAGSIQGTVTDSTGAVIPGATIHVVNQGTNVSTDTTSSSVGFYQVPALFAANYSITVTAPGMKSYRTSLQLLVDQHAVINPVMTPGEVTQQIEVAADVAQLTTTENGTIASTLENTRINQLPMNGRVLINLASMTTPGLETGNRANGLMGEALEYVADGVPISNRQFGGMNLSQTQAPDPDAVQEIRVETTNTGAQYSEPGTAIITTKSGTNALHGALFETARNNAIGIAKNRNNLATFAAPHLVRNEFGASIGGPIRIPHLYNGKDKSFWFFAYERYSYASPQSQLVSVAPDGERTGDFSWYTNSSGVAQQLYDPATTTSSTNCNNTGVANPYCRAPFGNGVLGSAGNNQIPIGRISPTFKSILAITPTAGNSNNPMLSGNTNLSVGNPTFNVVPTITFRLDHAFNEANRAYLRYTSNMMTSVALRNYNNGSGNFNATIASGSFPKWATGIANNPSASFASAIGFTHVFSPTFFSETIVSQQALGQHNYAGGDQTLNYASLLGLPNNFGALGFPAYGNGQLLNNGWGYGGTQFTYGLSQIVQNIDENMTKTVNRHQLQFGGRYRHERFGQLPDRASNSFSFNGQGTAIYDVVSDNKATTKSYSPLSNTGGNDPDAFLGNISSYNVTMEPPYMHFHDYEFDAYIQDNFHWTRTLTVNLGVRWEDHPAVWVKDGLYNSFDLKNHAQVLASSTKDLIAKGYTTQAIVTNMINNGAVYETAQQAGWPSTLMNNYPWNFSPRVGLAWQPFGGKHGTVIRGAYGRYIYPIPTRSFVKNPIQNNPMEASYSQTFTSSNQTYDGLANEQLRVPQNGTATWSPSSAFTPIAGMNTSGNNIVDSTSTTAIKPGVGLWANARNMPPDFVTQMNFTVEQALKGNSALRVTWLWTHGTNLDHYYNVNNAPSDFVWKMMTDTAVNTANGSIATRPYDSTVWGGHTWDVKNGWSNDNALQVTYQRLFHKGVAYQINYVWSKPFRMGGNYFRDAQVSPQANYLGALGVATGTTYSTGGAKYASAGTVLTPALPPAPPAGTLAWQEYHALDKFEGYKLDTAIPFQHITFNGVVELPFGAGKRFLGNSNRWEDLAVGGWQIAGAGQVVSQSFAVGSGNWGAINPITYSKGLTITDCQGTCQKAKQWFNGYYAPTAGALGKISGLPSGYTAGATTSPAYSSPIGFIGTTGAITGTDNNVSVNGTNTFGGTAFSPGPTAAHPYGKKILNGPINWNADLSVFKVFPIHNQVALRFNADAFNAFNIQGYNNPDGTTGEIKYQGNGLSSSYWTPRQIQLTLRLQF
ncbi:MAG: carboxypeptidase-like regulatory domain-containing protein [Terracidiphilus sp.]|nr:carboxypeptidase-like regulatory domain-containing protein [Terracidiphilus sp.]